MIEPNPVMVFTSSMGVPALILMMSPSVKPSWEATWIMFCPAAAGALNWVLAGAAFAGAAFDAFLAFFFFGLPLPPPIMAPMPPRQQQHKQISTIHNQIGNCEPQEPEAVDPELADPEESLAQDP